MYLDPSFGDLQSFSLRDACLFKPSCLDADDVISKCTVFVEIKREFVLRIWCRRSIGGLVPVSAVFAVFFGILRSCSAVCGLCLRSADSAVFGVTAQRSVGVDLTLTRPYGELPDHPKAQALGYLLI